MDVRVFQWLDGCFGTFWIFSNQRGMDAAHTTGGFFHWTAGFRKARRTGFAAASPPEKCPLLRMALHTPSFARGRFGSRPEAAPVAGQPWKTLRVFHFPTATTAGIIPQIPHSRFGPNFGIRSDPSSKHGGWITMNTALKGPSAISRRWNLLGDGRINRLSKPRLPGYRWSSFECRVNKNQRSGLMRPDLN